MQKYLRHIISVLVSIIFLVSIGFSQYFRERPHKSNYEIFLMLSTNLADSLISQNGLKQGDSVSFKMITTANDWFVENQIIRALEEKNITNVPHIPSTEDPQIQIECAVSRLFVNYSDIFRDGFLGSKKVCRSIGLELSGKIFVNKTLKTFQPIIATYNDTVLFSSIRSLEEQNIPATKGNIPDDTIIERLIIPTVVVSTVAVITYLFFTLRN